MPKIIISGCCGHMGHVLTKLCEEDADMEVVAGIDLAGQAYSSFPVYRTPADCVEAADVLVDFSTTSALSSLLTFCMDRRLPLVLCTTGYSEQQLGEIKLAANRLPLFRSANMSIGINLLLDLIKRAAFLLGKDFDIEIVEKHHRRKIDAPSGTALMLAEAAASGCADDMQYVFDRSPVRQPRQANEIGISAVRGGTIPGEHSVLFAGTDEVIEFKHTVYSRDVFAAGAIRAAKFMAIQTQPGMYSMSDIFS